MLTSWRSIGHSFITIIRVVFLGPLKDIDAWVLTLADRSDRCFIYEKMSFTVMLENWSDSFHSKSFDSRLICSVPKSFMMFGPPKYTRPFWRDASDDFGGPMFLRYLSNLSLENQTVKPFSKKIGISEAFMARNVKERGFLVDHLMDLIQRWARIPKENLDTKLRQVGEKKRGSRWKHVYMNCLNWVGTLYLYISIYHIRDRIYRHRYHIYI